jgi:hypothetical protein
MCHHIDGAYRELYAELEAHADGAADAVGEGDDEGPASVDLAEPPIGQFELLTTEIESPTLERED